MLLRIRTKVATWRVENVSPTTTIAKIRDRINREHHISPTAQVSRGKEEEEEEEEEEGGVRGRRVCCYW